jgi:UPF0755 protein
MIMKLLGYFLLVIIMAASVGGYSYWSGINEPLTPGGEEVLFTIGPGQGVKQIAMNLRESGLIGSDSLFNIYVWRQGTEKKLKAGNYLLDPGMNIKEIAAVLVGGEVIGKEKNLKIIEGWNLDDTERSFAENGFSENGEFIKQAKTRLGDWPFAFEKPDYLSDAPDHASLEGYLFPDTYRVYEDASPEDIIKRALENFGRKLTPELREEIDRQGRSIFDIVVLASIIEKEVRSPEDRKIVAGLLYKRMEIGMRLEVDATINFITGKNNPGSTREDLAIDSPYNTYKYYGLPPGPICNPGITAIEAAVYPEKSPYLFYLNRQDTGETIFSKNYNEHLANKAKYLK